MKPHRDWALHLVVKSGTAPYYQEAPPVCPDQLRHATGQLHVSVVIDTNVKLGTQRWGGVERAWVSHEMGWGVGIFDTLFSPHSSTLSRTFFFPRKFNLQGKRLIAVMTASVQMLPRVLVPWRKFQLRWDFGLSARRDVQMWVGGEAGQRLQGERKRRRHCRVTLG